VLKNKGQPFKSNIQIFLLLSLRHCWVLGLTIETAVKLQLTFCIYAGVGFENRLPGGNAEKKYDYKIVEMFFRTSQAPNKS